MQCPSCKKNQPMSFRCRSCGAELVKRPGSAPRPAARPSPAPQAAAAAVALENPYQAPDVAAQAPIHVSYGEKALAGRGSRLIAQFVDGLLFLTIYIPFFVAAAGGAESEAAVAGSMMAMLLILLGLAVVQIFYLSRDGQTIGKKAMKIRIVRYDDGGNPGFVKAVFLRAIANGFIGIIPGYALVDILFIFGAEKRCIHDYIAGTKVVEA